MRPGDRHVSDQRDDDDGEPQRGPPSAVGLRYRLRVPCPAQHQQAANAAERRIGAGRERRDARGVDVHRVEQGRDEPRQAAQGQGGQADHRPAEVGREQDAGQHDQRGDRHRGEPADDGGQHRQPQPSGSAPRREVGGEHRPQDPGQARVPQEQRPLADDQPLGHVRVPRVVHAAREPGEQRLPVQQGHRPGAGEEEDRQQHRLLHDVGRQNPGGGGDHEVTGYRARRGRAGQGRGERLARDEHHVVAEQETPLEPGPERQQPEGEASCGAGDPGAGPGGGHTYPMRLESIWSRSPLKPPMPLVTPPPPDHCHMSAWLLELVWPPKNCAHGPDPWFRHQPDGLAPV